MFPKTRPVSWVKAALKEFAGFPEGAKTICLTALTIAAKGGKADIAKPMYGMGPGVFEMRCHFAGMRFEWSTPCRWLMKYGLYTHFRRSPGRE